MTDTTQTSSVAAGWQGVALDLGKLLIAALVGAGGLWGVQKVASAPTITQQVVSISAEDIRKAFCPAPRRVVKVEGNAYGTTSK